jgi:glycosyltransferase involved in cell wall biosynthesis
VVHSFYSRDSPSGENIVVEGQVNALRTAGHDVALISRETDKERGSRLYGVKAAVAAAGMGGPSPDSQLRAFGPDIVHVHNLFPNWGTKWMLKWSERVVTTVHNYRPVCSSALLWRDGSDCTECISGSSFSAVKHQCYRDSALATMPLAWATRSKGKHSSTLNSSAVLVALNTRSRDVYKSVNPSADVRLVPNFATATAPAVPVAPRSSFVYVGRLTEEKGIRWLLDNWPSSQHLTIIGDGPLADLVAGVCAENPAKFAYLGRQAVSDTRRAISSACGLVLPSLWAEGIPTVALEALAAGTPVLVSGKCASASDLTDNAAGVVFDTDGGKNALLAAIDKVSASSEMRDRAVDLYQREFSEESWVSRMESIYQEVVGVKA